jgi:hypothetical protein
MFCRHCGNRLPDYARFCNQCGTPQIPPAQEQPGAAPRIVRSSGPTNNPEIYPPSNFMPVAPPMQAPGVPAAAYPAPPFPNAPRRG